jgi:hypothetical protein
VLLLSASDVVLCCYVLCCLSFVLCCMLLGYTVFSDV